MSYGPVRYAPMLSIAAGSITGSYATLGTVTESGRIVAFINDTDAGVLLSFNASSDNIYLAAGSSQIWDFQGNATDGQNNFALSINTVISIKYPSGAPSTGSVYVEIVYAKPI